MTRLILLALLFQSALCTRENIARNKTVYQSKTFYWAPGSNQKYNWSAEFAIDGKTTFKGDMCRCCSGAGYEGKGKSPWWEIDLGTIYSLGKVCVHGRFDDKGIHQLRGFEMFLSDTTPYANSSTSGPVYVNSVKKKQYKAEKGETLVVLGEMAARYVTISIPPRSTRTLMVLCEVEIFQACEDNEFEPDCTPCHCLAGPCNKSTGMCQTGCQSGWTGPSCNITCGKGKYGVNCTKPCGICYKKNTCNATSGHCEDGCSRGYQEPFCTEECQSGRYGRGCNKTCGHCLNNDTCNHINGSCPNGCAAGYNGHRCHQKNCGNPRPVENGSFKVTGSASPSSSKAMLTCNDGYELSDSDQTTITCRNGTWNSLSTACKPKDCEIPKHIDHGRFNVTGRSASGSQVTLTCHVGYKLSVPEQPTIRCLNGNWSKPQTTCTPKDCGNPKPVDNGGFNVTRPETPSGSQATLTCYAGYSLSDRNQTTITCLNGNWSNLLTTCTPKDCEIPKHVDHGSFNVTGRSASGSQVTLTCHVGYKLSDPDQPTIRCLNGNWSKPKTTCTPKDCGNPKPVDNGGFNVTRPETPSGSQATLTCYAGYSLSDRNQTTITCLNGNWSNLLTTCTPKDCEIPKHVDHGSFNVTGRSASGSQVTLTCHVGYKLSDPDQPTIRCLNGNWSKPQTTCTPKDCEIPKHVDHGSFNVTERSASGSQVTLTCHVGYKLSVPDQPTIRCLNGNWSKPQTTCTPKDCGNPKPVDNGSFNVTRPETPSGSQATLTCDAGYSLSDRNQTTITCLNGNWSNLQTTCTPKVTSESFIDKESSTGFTVGLVMAVLGVLGFILTTGILLRYRRNKTNAESLPLAHMTVPDDNDEAPTPTGGVDNPIAGVALRAAYRPAADDLPDALYAVPNKDNKDKAIPVHELWDFVQTQRGENFELLTSQYKSLKSGLLHKHEVGSRPENRTKHRYRDMIPYDRNRVKLQVTRPGETDYINASIIDGFDSPGKFIASQGPINSMVDDFWRMIWQQQTSIVVMLTNLVEGEKTKCIKYWPEEGEARTFGLVKVVLKSIDRVLDYDVRRLDVKYDGNEYRRVTQYHFKSWPDKDVPANAWCLVHFWRVVDEAASSATPAPIVVHCSAGIGRTGTFIALDNTRYQGKQTGGVSPLTIVKALRQQRINMVQTRGQYVYLHEAVAEALLFGTDCVSVSQFEDMIAYMRQGSRLESQFQLIEKSVDNHINEADALYGNVSIREIDANSVQKHRIEPVLFQNYLKKNTFVLCNYPSEPNSEEAWTRLLAFKPMTIVTLPDDRTGMSLSFGRRAPESIPVRLIEEHRRGSYTEVIFDVSLSTEPQSTHRSVKVFEYSCWQAGCSIPDDTRSLLEMVRAIRLWQPTLADDKPIIIMCSDGFSRSGLVCALLSEIDRIECTDGQTNFVHTVKTMKATMTEVIRNCDQYRFCMDTLLSYITKADQNL